ncbi:hypothetical protein F4819DRAFT_447380 [Hypoxylon fuscum]|nr:hypothetical protein F4819DRAFT_447380 [Hypoxylon fuscum]
MVNKLCREKLTGRYEGHGRRASCGPVAGTTTGLSYFYMIRRIKDDPRELPYNECVSGLSKEINSCTYGGRTSYTNWEYT